jgi:hypothetical protein
MMCPTNPIFVCPFCGREDLMVSSDNRFVGCIRDCFCSILPNRSTALDLLMALRRRLYEAIEERDRVIDSMLQEMEAW